MTPGDDEDEEDPFDVDAVPGPSSSLKKKKRNIGKKSKSKKKTTSTTNTNDRKPATSAEEEDSIWGHADTGFDDDSLWGGHQDDFSVSVCRKSAPPTQIAQSKAIPISRIEVTTLTTTATTTPTETPATIRRTVNAAVATTPGIKSTHSSKNKTKNRKHHSSDEFYHSSDEFSIPLTGGSEPRRTPTSQRSSWKGKLEGFNYSGGGDRDEFGVKSSKFNKSLGDLPTSELDSLMNSPITFLRDMEKMSMGDTRRSQHQSKGGKDIALEPSLEGVVGFPRNAIVTHPKSVDNRQGRSTNNPKPDKHRGRSIDDKKEKYSSRSRSVDNKKEKYANRGKSVDDKKERRARRGRSVDDKKEKYRQRRDRSLGALRRDFPHENGRSSRAERTMDKISRDERLVNREKHKRRSAADRSSPEKNSRQATNSLESEDSSSAGDRANNRVSRKEERSNDDKHARRRRSRSAGPMKDSVLASRRVRDRESRRDRSRDAASRSVGRSVSPLAIERKARRRQDRALPKRSRSNDEMNLFHASMQDLAALGIPVESLQGSDISPDYLSPDGSSSSKVRPPRRTKSLDLDLFGNASKQRELHNVLDFGDRNSSKLTSRRSDERSMGSSDGKPVSKGRGSKKSHSTLDEIKERDVQPDGKDDTTWRIREEANLAREKRKEEEARLKRLQEESKLMEEKRLTEEARLRVLQEEAKLLEARRLHEEARLQREVEAAEGREKEDEDKKREQMLKGSSCKHAENKFAPKKEENEEERPLHAPSSVRSLSNSYNTGTSIKKQDDATPRRTVSLTESAPKNVSKLRRVSADNVELPPAFQIIQNLSKHRPKKGN